MLMKRTTIMADEALLAQLREIARDERRPLAEIIREGLEWRARRESPRLRFLAIGASGQRDTAQQAAEMDYEPPSWR